MKGNRQPLNRRLRRGAYLLPSILTIGNILLGFYALVRGLRGDFSTAALLIFIAGALDGLDGRIARMTGTESDFGREFDSMADALTFGTVPPVLAYIWGLDQLGRIGWLLPLFFLVCASTRLARYNVQTKVADSRYFVGLPAPAAGGSIAAILYFASDRNWGQSEPVLLAALALLGLLMVSTFRYWSLKRIDLRQRWSYRMALPLVTLMLVIAYDPPLCLLAVAVIYVASGPTNWAASRWASSRRAKAGKLQSKESDV